MRNRIPAKPNRRLITPEDGAAAYYAKIERADEPIEEGSPLTAENMLSDSTAAGMGLGADAMPDDAFAKLTELAGAAQAAAEGAIDALSRLFLLEITFEASFAGKIFTVTGEGFDTYTGTVPASLQVTVGVTKANTTYTVKSDTGAKTVTTANYFGVYPVTVYAFSTILADNTWDEIARAANAGIALNLWKVGDTKNITLTTNETLTLQIYGFGHDDLTNSGKASITFGLKNLMAATRQMNSTNTNVGGFTGSAMYTWLTGTLINYLPEDLQAVIKSVNKKTSAGGQSSTIYTNSMKVFLFSEIECFGTTAYSAAGEGSQYPIFTDAASRIKYLSNGSGTTSVWWSRSPWLASTSGFAVVSAVGNVTNGNANGSFGVCFGFCI